MARGVETPLPQDPFPSGRAWLQISHWHIPVVVTIPGIITPGQAQAPCPREGARPPVLYAFRRALGRHGL